jgi:hypothetical protein
MTGLPTAGDEFAGYRLRSVWAAFADCGSQKIYGEVSWNHQFQHPRIYSVAQSSSGNLTAMQAAGRVFCTYANGQETMVWPRTTVISWVLCPAPVHQDVWN